MTSFASLNQETLNRISGGSRESYCSGQLTAIMLFKTLTGQRLVPSDFICK